MSLKFTVAEDMGGYSLFIDTAQTNIEVGATEDELRRLLIDLTHELGDDCTVSPAIDQDGGQA